MEPGTSVDRYTVEAQLGEGGIAVVYRVRHARLQTSHAMKVLKLPHAAIQDRLLQEGRIQASLQHPNIVSVTDVVDVDGSPGLVMEYVDGSNLEQLLLDRRLSFEQADHLARGILNGTRAAHGVGLIHRDLKPANILLAVKGSEMIPKITDFGLAKLLDDAHPAGASPTGAAPPRSGLTRSGVAMGTPSYMAPEQIRSAADVDVRADVFSLGAILYELVTGQRAYDSEDLLALFNAIAQGRRTPLTDLVPDIPRRMQRAIDGALRVDPDERIANTEALLQVWTGEILPEASKGPFNTELFDRVRALGQTGAGLAVESEVEDQLELAKKRLAFEEMETPRDPRGPAADSTPPPPVSEDDQTFPFERDSGPPSREPEEPAPDEPRSEPDEPPGIRSFGLEKSTPAPGFEPVHTDAPTEEAPLSDEAGLADDETEVAPPRDSMDSGGPPLDDETDLWHRDPSRRPTVAQPRGPRTPRRDPLSDPDVQAVTALPSRRGRSWALLVGIALLAVVLVGGFGAALIGGGVLASIASMLGAD